MTDAGHHPADQTMAAFLEGTLGKDDRTAVAAHLRDCADCRIVVAETARFEREEERLNGAAPRHVAAPRRMWWPAAAAAVLAAIAITIPLLRSTGGRDASQIAQLVAAAPKDHRVVAARLSDFPWARVKAPSRGEALPDPADLKLRGAAGEVLEETQTRTDAASRHANGVALLVIGRTSDSVAVLEEAARDSKSARAWNDLAVARYTLAVTEDRPSDLELALANVDRAIQLGRQFAEAYFNRALILERLGRHDEARGAWQRYLQIDPSSEWSAEARQHLQRLGPANI